MESPSTCDRAIVRVPFSDDTIVTDSSMDFTYAYEDIQNVNLPICQIWNEITQEWDNNYCVTLSYTNTYVDCSCSKVTTFRIFHFLFFSFVFFFLRTRY